MKLALRKTAQKNATKWQRFACWAIKARLVSQYCHGGIVIDGWLYHATASNGLHRLSPQEWTPDNWDLVDVPGDDAVARGIFDRNVGAQYDWFSLLVFVGLRVRDADRFYCFEWCWLAMTGQTPTFRVTPEILLALALGKGDV